VEDLLLQWRKAHMAHEGMHIGDCLPKGQDHWINSRRPTYWWRLL